MFSREDFMNIFVTDFESANGKNDELFWNDFYKDEKIS